MRFAEDWKGLSRAAVILIAMVCACKLPLFMENSAYKGVTDENRNSTVINSYVYFSQAIRRCYQDSSIYCYWGYLSEIISRVSVHFVSQLALLLMSFTLCGYMLLEKNGKVIGGLLSVLLHAHLIIFFVKLLTISHVIFSRTANNTTPYIPKNAQALTASIGNGLKLAAKIFTPTLQSNYFWAIGVNVLFLGLILLFCDLKYEVSDDFVMASAKKYNNRTESNPPITFPFFSKSIYPHKVS